MLAGFTWVLLTALDTGEQRDLLASVLSEGVISRASATTYLMDLLMSGDTYQNMLCSIVH